MEVLAIVSLALALVLLGLGVFCILKNSKLSQDLSSKNATLSFLQEQKISLEEQKLILERQLNEARLDIKNKSENLVLLEQEKVFLEREKENLKAWVSENSQRMQKDFELLATKIFDEAKVKFSNENKDKISTVLEPLKLNLSQFSTKLEQMTVSGATRHTSLIEQIKHLGELNKQVSEDANMLAKVLKHDNKAAGDWGEMILEKTLESCGLLEGQTFFKQESLKGENDKNFRPDIVIKLPQDRTIIVDSKLSLLDFLKYSTGEVEEKVALKAFKNSIESHIKLLAKKNYEDLLGVSSPEFVMIFIPIEGAFSLLSRVGQELFELAYANKIVLASPSTLLSGLKTIEFLWRVDKQDKNFAEIAKLGGLLYDRVALFLNRYKDLGEKIEATQKIYLDAEKTLYEGKASIANTAHRLESLGAKTKAKIKKEDNNED